MENVEVLIVVDGADAISHSDLQNNVYLVDTNKYLGSSGEGTNELCTECQDGQTIRWRVEPISEGNKVSISQFSGQIINETCMPTCTRGRHLGRTCEHTRKTAGTISVFRHS